MFVLQSNFYNYKSLTDAFSSIVKNDGVRGLFAGYGATFIRDAPFAGIYLFFYEHCKSTANGKYGCGEPYHGALSKTYF
jgi:solute carrier family 25, member 38